MDLLDRVAAPAADLLGRVDAALLAAGAPADHVIWPLLRRVGALPGEVLVGICALRGAPLLAAAADLRQRADAYVAERAALAGAVSRVEWQGDSAAELADRWRSLAAHLGETTSPDQETLIGRLVATASYVEDVAAWTAHVRRALARVVAEALGSAEAVRLHGRVRSAFDVGAVDPPTAQAAAAIGARVLECAVEQVHAAEQVHDRWAGRLGELVYRPAAGPVSRSGEVTRAAL